MAKGKKRGSRIEDVLHIIDIIVEGNRMDHNQEDDFPEYVDESSLHAWKRLFINNMKKPSTRIATRDMENVQSQQQKHTSQSTVQIRQQEQAYANATNRGQRKFPHRTGMTVFSEVVDELELKGMPATQLDVWLVSRSLGKGVIDDGETTDLHDFLVGTMTSVPVEERTSEFRAKLYQDAVRNDKYGRVTCVGKSIHKKSCSSSRSRLSQIIQEREELREELHKFKEEKEEFKQIKEQLQKERKQMGLKLQQVN
ncbi:hypothetical protein LIER_19536 [Lithospermum erythrorhizon]|uniref:Uncharacterized protein n=1 Tax=Lithospermum erythrorhizon TaxID=34254 RepID=A0AAV3QL41_LITER